MMDIYTAFVEDLKEIDKNEFQIIAFCINNPEDSEIVNFGSLVPGKEMCKSYVRLKDDMLFLKTYYEHVVKPLIFKNDCMLTRMLEIAGKKRLVFVRAKSKDYPDYFSYIIKAFQKKYELNFIQLKFRKQIDTALF